MPESLIIKLISPRMSLRPMDSEFKRRMSPPLSLVTIATLTPKQHFVFIEDENTGPLKFDDNPDIVGITVNVDTAYRAFEISASYRNRDTKVIFGGIHASSNPDAMLEHCDSVVIGEAEELWTSVLDDFSSGNLKQKYFCKQAADLKKAPVPDRNFISETDYLYDNIIVTSRGCPFHCEFCYNSCDYTTKKFRHREIGSLIEEIKALDRRRIMFIDDNLIGNIDWALEISANLSPLNIFWHAAVSADIVNHPGLIRKMAASGCKSLFIGFESINSQSLKSINKAHNRVNEYNDLIKILHDNGIMVNASLVFGFDHDTPDTFGQTLDWLNLNKVETMTAHILTPYPGTKLYARFFKEDRIIDFDLGKYNTSNVVFRPQNMTPEELKAGYLKIYKDFYSIRNIISRIPENRTLIAPYLIFNLGYRKLGKITSRFGKAIGMKNLGRLGSKLSYGLE